MRLKSGLKPDVVGSYRDGEQFGMPEVMDLQAHCSTHDDAVLDLLIRPKGGFGTFGLTILTTPKGRT